MGVRSSRLDSIGDEPLSGHIYNVFTFRDAKIACVQDYRSRSEAFTVAGAVDLGWASDQPLSERIAPDGPSAPVDRPLPASPLSSAPIDTEDPVAKAAVAAIHAGDIEAMRRLRTPASPPPGWAPRPKAPTPG